MPRPKSRNKKTGSQMGGPAPRAGSAPRSIGDLLTRSRAPALRRVGTQPFDWIGFLSEELIPDLSSRITTTEWAEGGRLVIYTESAVWCTRLRYALAEALPAIQGRRPEIRRIEVRIAPERASG
jgi:hypothetical protein